MMKTVAAWNLDAITAAYLSDHLRMPLETAAIS